MLSRILPALPALLIGAVLVAFVNSAACAAPDSPKDEQRPSPEKIHRFIEMRLDKLSKRLEIKASQEPAWGAFRKSVEALAETPAKRPGENANAAEIAHFRADRTAEMARKLSAIADATDKLEAVLTDDQRKILDESARHFRHHAHCGGDHGHDGHGHHEHKEGQPGE